MAVIKFLKRLMEWCGIKKEIALLVVSGIALVISFFNLIPAPVNPAWVAIILCGIPIILEAVIGLVTEFDITADVLVACALLASVYIREDFAAGEVAFIMQLGALLENITVARARAGIEKLVRLTPRTARVLRNGIETVIPAEDVQVGDTLIVKPGETIAVDGVISKGQTSINQAVMTGESIPADKKEGDEVFSGTTNLYGTFEMTAVKVSEDSSIQRMIRLVQSADAGKAKIVTLADRWAVWIVVISLVTAIVAWLATGEIVRGVTVLVVFCPCALVLATPTAIMATIGNVTKHSFLVREGDALERLSKVSRIMFDKTGTLTNGEPEIVGLIAENISEEELFRLAASAERPSEHPLGKAVTQCWREKNDGELPQPDNFETIPGQGVIASVRSQEVLAGNLRLLESYHVPLSADTLKKSEEWLNQGCTLIYVAANRQYIGFLILADTVRHESGDMIKALHDVGIQATLITGDNEKSASAISAQLGISDYHANCLPEDKLRYIDSYENHAEAVCMIGDGINDAPALKKATVGIAMGGIGSDIAVDAADIVLVNDDMKELPHLFALSRRMMRVIKSNLVFSMVLNFLAVSLAVAGKLNPIVGALVHNAGSVFVIVNSAFLLGWRKK